MATLDHLILPVNDLEASVQFLVEIMGFVRDGRDGPFTVVRVSPDLILLLAPSGTSGAHGMGASIYLFDPNKHLLEIRTDRTA